MSRSQCSQQIVYLLNSTGLLGAGNSAFEAVLPVEEYLASELTLPLAAVEIMDSVYDRDTIGRIESTMYRVSVVGAPVSEPKVSNYVASGGSVSSQHSVENLIRQILLALTAGAYPSGAPATGVPPGTFVNALHGFQGTVSKVSQERIVVALGAEFSIADLEIMVSDTTYADYYHPIAGLRATPGAAHAVALAWDATLGLNYAGGSLPRRYDHFAVVLRRGINPGDPAPVLATDGVGVTISNNTASDAGSGAGQVFNYSLFRQYTAVAPGDQVARSTVSVTTT